MKATDYEPFRRALIAQRQRLIQRGGKQYQPVDPVGAGGVPDFADYAAASAVVEVGDQIADSEDQLLAKIDLALKRLDEGKYQECASCGGKISLERLRAKPSASLCVKCQAEKEQAST